MILTNDGDLASCLENPRTNLERVPFHGSTLGLYGESKGTFRREKTWKSPKSHNYQWNMIWTSQSLNPFQIIYELLA
jgi:hypothetical protein